VLANRLKDVLPFIISPNQSVFNPGRLICDNVLTLGKTGHVAIKLDMSKAYDQVERGFLDDVMRRIGFAQHWRGLKLSRKGFLYGAQVWWDSSWTSPYHISWCRKQLQLCCINLEKLRFFP
jgi:hypothetical protein